MKKRENLLDKRESQIKGLLGSGNIEKIFACIERRNFEMLFHL